MANKSVSVPITTTGELVVEAISSAVCTLSVSASDFACLTWIPASSRIGVQDLDKTRLVAPISKEPILSYCSWQIW